MSGPFYRAGSWVTTLIVGERTPVGGFLLGDLQSWQPVRVFLTIERPSLPVGGAQPLVPPP